MNDAEQREGEKRVRDCLIQPLLDLGLTKPGTMRKEQFEGMLRMLAQTLAYMDEAALADLRLWAGQHPGGKDRDRFPLALHILERARSIRPPDGADASPFIRRVMAHAVGQAALAGGYAPELLDHIRAARGDWPGAWTISQIRDKADDARRRYDDLLMKRARGDDLSEGDMKFIEARAAKIEKCRRIAELGAQDGAAA